MLHFVFYTERIIPTRFAGVTYGPFVFIRPKYKSDQGLLQHELIHVRQFWANPLFGLWYLLSAKHRFKYEAEAYKAQLSYYSTDQTVVFAKHLVDKYNLNITLEEAVQALTK